VRNHLSHTGGCEAYTVFMVLDFLRDSNQHKISLCVGIN
jgi:hypothetical protein